MVVYICTPQRWFQTGFVASPAAETSNDDAKMTLSRADDASVIIFFLFGLLQKKKHGSEQKDKYLKKLAIFFVK